MVDVRKGLTGLKGLIALFAILLAPLAHAQFLGYVSPQGTQQTLATSTLCTGAAQVFAINNLGQTQHYLSIANVSGATKFQAEIDGIDRQGNVVRISDILSPISNGAVTGAGYFPSLQVQVTCSPNTATFTASYSGGWGTFNSAAGGYLTGQIDKQVFAGISAASNQTATFQTPFGSSGGTIVFQYATGITGSSVSVTCTTSGGVLNTTPAVTGAISSLVGAQAIQVPDTGCPIATVNYTSGGGGTTFNLEYLFAVPGMAQHTTTDPCASGTQKSSAQIIAAAASTSTVVSLTNGLSIYVCGFLMSQVATAGTVSWLYGTGANCVTGPVTLMSAMGVTASQPLSYGNGGATVMKTAQSNALCLTTTGAGGSVSGILTYVQQTP